MALRPRIIVEAIYKPGAEKRSSFPILSAAGMKTVEVKPQSKKPRFLPVFHGKVDQIIGLNADWCEIHIENKNNEYDWLLKEIDSLQFKVYMGYSNRPMSDNPAGVVEDLKPAMIHAWAGKISSTFGSQGKLITIEGGDASYVLNKGYTGDYMARRTPTEQAKQPKLPDGFIVHKNAWDIIKIITGAVEKEGKWTTPEGIVLSPTKDFVNDSTVVSGSCKMEYLPNTISDQEKEALKAKRIYQINNNTKLEVVDDVCFKTGYFATVIPGSNELKIGGKKDFAPTEIQPLKSWGGTTTEDDKQREKGSWIKFSKIPHLENGLELAINYWDWQLAIDEDKKVYGYNKKKLEDELITGIAHFLGSEEEDAQVMCWVGYEPVSKAAAERRAYLAANRICSQRVVARGQVPGNPKLIPNTLAPVEGCGIWDYKYLVVHASHACGMVGYSTMFDLRLPDLVEVHSDDEAKKNPMTTIRVGKYVKE